MYAIIDDAGKQYKVTSGDRIRIDRPTGEPKPQTITFDRVLLVGGEGNARVGAPTVAGATVEAEVIDWVKGKKIDIQKYKRRKGYHRKMGHRQQYLEVKVTAIKA